MPVTLTVHIKNCSECNHVDHSGAFTPGGSKPVCGHPDSSACVKKAKGLRDEDANIIPDSELGKQCWYWKNRVIPYKVVENDIKGHFGVPRTSRVPKSIPSWCPLRNGSQY